MSQSLTYRFKMLNIAHKLIVINVLIFLLVTLSSFLFGLKPSFITKWFVLPDSFIEWLLQPWSIITYSFLHFDFFHILFNMLWLNWFSTFVLNLFNNKRYLTIYFLGAISGGLLYMLSYNLFPVFSNSSAILLGASASVTAIMVFIATYTPNTAFRIFTWTIKLWQIALFLFLLDLVRLPTGGNAGGMISHVGGAIFGYVYAIQLAKGNDIGKWFESIMDWFTDLFKTRKQKPFKKVHRNTNTTKTTSKSTQKRPAKPDNQKKIDAILDKISKSGYDSLTKAEKDFLFKAGKE